ncbi:MAG: hypothetical protein JWM10_362 [Myxococcaceae bacterium]|nr:hypothetical protein [Myxococcaceae bacterium]
MGVRHTTRSRTAETPTQKTPGGAPLPTRQRGEAERAFGLSFEGVRVHQGGHAEELARAQGARAVTYGTEIFFRRGDYRPGTLHGDAILAHELAHVAQQAYAPAAAHAGHTPSIERDADTSALAALFVRQGVMKPGAAKPRQRGGLALRRCPSGSQPSLDAQRPSGACGPDLPTGTATPASLSRAQFLTATRGARVAVTALRMDPDLAGGGLEAADANHDGEISGPDWPQVFRLLGDGRRVLLREAGRPTSAATMITALARHAGGGAMATAIGPTSLAGAVTILGMSDTSVVEATALRAQAPTQLITDVSRGNRGDLILRSDGGTGDLAREDQLRAFVASLPIPADVGRNVGDVLHGVGPGARRELAELARVWAGAYCGRAVPARVIVSGHGDGVWVSGDDLDFFRREQLLALGRAMPRAAAQIYSIHLGTCQHGWEPRFAAYPTVFPNVQILWGYAGTSPSASTSALLHQRVWERGTHDFPPGGGMLRPSAVSGSSRGDVVSVWTRAHGFSGPTVRPVGELLRRAEGGLPQFVRCMEGLDDLGTPHSGFPDTYYQLLQELTTYPDVDHDWEQRREQTLRLRFYMTSVRAAFQREHRSLIQEAYRSIGLPAPDFSTLDRRQALEQIRLFEEALRSHPNDPGARRVSVIFQGLVHLDPVHIPFTWVLL